MPLKKVVISEASSCFWARKSHAKTPSSQSPFFFLSGLCAYTRDYFPLWFWLGQVRILPQRHRKFCKPFSHHSLSPLLPHPPTRLSCLKFNHRASDGRLFQEGERPPDNGQVAVRVVWRSDGPAHQVRRNHQAGEVHSRHAVSKSSHTDDDGGDAGGFHGSGNVSHGHVTDRSNRNQERQIDLGLQKHLRPLRCDHLGQGGLGARPHKGVSLRC